jgi:hypothetical protein
MAASQRLWVQFFTLVTFFMAAPALEYIELLAMPQQKALI